MLPILLLLVRTHAAEPAATSLQTQSEAILVDSLSAAGQWSSIHAAEYLIRLDAAPRALAAFRPQADSATPQYRIGVWRVLVQAEPAPADQIRYVERIRSVLLDPNAEDRLHALESLAKLHVTITAPGELEIVEQLADSPDFAGRSFAIWRLLQAKPTPKLLDLLQEELAAADEVRRLRAAFVCGQVKQLRPVDRAKLRQLAASEPQESIAYPYLAIAAGQAAASRLANSKNPAHRALALKELTMQGIDVEIVPAVDLAEETPLALRQATAFAVLAKQRSDNADLK